MYLSKVALKQSRNLFEFLLKKNGTDGYVVHQLLWSLFPNDGSKNRDFLFYKIERKQLPFFLLCSLDKPVENEMLGVNAKEYSPRLKIGDKLTFILQANPVISRREGGKSFRHDVLMDVKYRLKGKNLTSAEVKSASEIAAKEWLIAQGKRTGFSCSLESIIIDGYKKHIFYKKKGGAPIKFSSVHYEGILRVTDPEKFVEMLKKGLGKSKAFGCGLMLIRRI